MIYNTKPENFNSKFDVVSCFLEHNGKILLLHRQDHKPEGNTWGVPAGKVNDGEELHETMIREIKEETDLRVIESELKYHRKMFVKYEDYDFVYHMFHMEIKEKPNIVINSKEHKDFRWISPKEALKIDLIQDEDACIKLHYGL